MYRAFCSQQIKVRKYIPPAGGCASSTLPKVIPRAHEPAYITCYFPKISTNIMSPPYIIRLPTPTANSPVTAMTSHCALPPTSAPFIPALFFVAVVVAAEDVEEPVFEAVFTAFAGPMLPPWTTEGVGALETLAAAATNSASVEEPSDLNANSCQPQPGILMHLEDLRRVNHAGHS